MGIIDFRMRPLYGGYLSMACLLYTSLWKTKKPPEKAVFWYISPGGGYYFASERVPKKTTAMVPGPV